MKGARRVPLRRRQQIAAGSPAGERQSEGAQAVIAMSVTACGKCGGLLVIDRQGDYYEAFAGWKCVNCGWAWGGGRRSGLSMREGRRVPVPFNQWERGNR